jgi:adenylylsulfate kinase
MTYEHTDGRVLWITGLSGAGKTTLAKALLPHMGPRVVLLDGDELRTALNLADSGFDKESRKGLAFTYARLARMIALQRFTVVVATISLFHELHAWNRAHLPGYYEVWLDVPEEECRRRDPKRLYAADLPWKNWSRPNVRGTETAGGFPWARRSTLLSRSSAS